MKHRVATELYSFPWEKENINKTFDANGKMAVATISGFGSRLCEGKVLAPLASVVLNGNLLFSFRVRKCSFNLFACFLLMSWFYPCVALLKYIQKGGKY